MKMAGVTLIEPTDLYNMLNQETTYPCLSDPVYLLLLDARLKDDYNESHVITAKFVSKNNDEFIVPYDADVECKTHVVVYDGNTSSVNEYSPATTCALKMWEIGSRNPVEILRGGYEEFSALYPFLRTKKIIYMPRELDALETYPVEIFPGHLYLGNWKHGNIPYIQKDLKIKGHINCCRETDTFFTDGPNLFALSIDDSLESDVITYFKSSCNFIDNYKESNKVVLVYSKLGISRSAAVVIAYVMYANKWSFKEAFDYVKRCCHKICPNQSFISQLREWGNSLNQGNGEKEIADKIELDERYTDEMLTRDEDQTDEMLTREEDETDEMLTREEDQTDEMLLTREKDQTDEMLTREEDQTEEVIEDDKEQDEEKNNED